MKPSPDPIYLSHILQVSFSPTPAPPFILWLLLALNFFLSFFLSFFLVLIPHPYHHSTALNFFTLNSGARERTGREVTLFVAESDGLASPGPPGRGRHQAEWASTWGREMLSLS